MPTFRDILKTYWGHDDFRGIQLDIIRSIASGKDTLGLMPTGGGKSITFQVPALAMPGICLVVTPLIALMKDQVAHLRERGIKAAAIYSGMTHDDILRQLDNCILGDYKFLYISPERLATPLFLNKVCRMRVSFLTVDEAHCISQWGYDFRPAYLRIADMRQVLPDAPVLALTATATRRVVDDIQAQLAFREGRVFRMGFERKNLCYVVRRTEDKEQELLHILRSVPGSAIVYTRSRNGTRDTAHMLEGEGIPALFYHAGLTDMDKDVRQRAWQEGETRVMVATNAFGMGIDKPDVRLVVHLDPPDSIEAYFQEAGRAGRDGQTAYAVLLYGKHDHATMLRRIPDTYPDIPFIRKVYDELAYYFQLAMGDGYGVTYEFDLDKFSNAFRHFPTTVSSALAILTRAGYIDFREEDDTASRLMFLLDRDELYALRRTGPEAEAVLRAVLRTYGGVFSDYVHIDERIVARQAKLTEEQVYEALKLLTHQRVLHYVPRKRTPRLTYAMRRIESRHLRFPPMVYENRRRQFEEQIHAILDYAEADDTCRSRYLLRYFDDDSADDCGHCDVCWAHRREQPDYRRAAEALMRILADGKPHRPDELRLDGYTSETRSMALQYLVAEELATWRDGFLVAQ